MSTPRSLLHVGLAFPWAGWRAMLAAAEQTLTSAADPAWRAEPRTCET